MTQRYISSLAPMITGFLEYKHSLGYKYGSGAYYLYELDRYCHENGYGGQLTKELVEGWILAKESRNPSPYRSWISPIREFGKYLQSFGYPDAYIVSDQFTIRKYHPMPYLFTEDEIEIFFKTCDSIVLEKHHQGRHLVIPVFFRFMYSCGVRTKEARLLRVKDVYLDASYVDIIGSKGHRDRRLYLQEDLKQLLSRYESEIAVFFPEREYFFPSTTGTCYSASGIGRNFNLIWDAAGLRKGCRKQPRSYSFRHHFAFANINRWATEGKNVNAMLPYLMRYMGHSSLEGTYYYIHLVPDFFPNYTEMTLALEDVLPEVSRDEE